MSIQIPIFSQLIYYTRVFYTYLKYRLILLIGIIFLSGVFDGLGISIIIPLLSYTQSSGTGNQWTKMVTEFLDTIGIGSSFASILGLLVFLFSIKAVVLIFQTVYSSKITLGFEKELCQGFCHKYSKLDYRYYIQKNIGYFNNIITKEAGTAVAGLNTYIKLVVIMVYIVVYLGSAFLINPELTGLVLLIAGVLLVALRKVGHLLTVLSVKLTQSNSEIQSLLIQFLYNFKYLSSTGSFGPLLVKLNDALDRNIYQRFKSGVLNAVPSSCTEPFTIVILLGLVWYYVELKGKQLAEILVLLVFFYRTLQQVLQFQNIWHRFCSFIGSILVVEDANNELAMHKAKTGPAKVKSFSRKIRLADVNFFYDQKQVLHHINLDIPKNKTIGIVGASGAGKTTLFDIMTGLLVPQSGRVLLDGVDYKGLDLESLRQQIGYVTQDPVIFNDTIANNISFWDFEKTKNNREENIKHAAIAANCLDFIQNTEKGFETVIGDRGVLLSGGQRQRIAIAREIYKNPQILIFDEATSSLDSESEAYIQKSIHDLMGQCTIVIIAHRLSTIKDCDLIYVLNQGDIVEKGSFKELFAARNSFFYKMCEAQNINS